MTSGADSAFSPIVAPDGAPSQIAAPDGAPFQAVPGGACPVVAMGASSGGLEAFKTFFAALPPDPGLAFVLVQHLAPDHDTLIPELLAGSTPLPVQVAAEETVVAPNRVYVAPPDAVLTLDDCVLRVSRPVRARRRMPIDRFFRSLAEDLGDEAIGVILSGSGTDGALGLLAIRERGGLTLVQMPTTAQAAGMPRRAIEIGAAQHVLQVEQMPAVLLEHAVWRGEVARAAGDVAADVAAHLGRISALLRQGTGRDFSRYKQSTLVRRVRRRMQVLAVASAAEYVARLVDDAGEVDELFRDLLIGVTHFFRDREAFQTLADQVVPALFEGKDADGYVRVWVPGCASGEEAYSLAMLLSEHAARLAAPPHLQIFATDIDGAALEAARQGWYPPGISEQVAPERLERFFVRHGNMYQVAREVREVCLFSTHDLIADPPFSRLDLISCRNLLIYLESDLQKRVIPLFHYALNTGGYLFLGPSESVSGRPDLFRAVDKRHRLFQAKSAALRPPVRFPLTERRDLGRDPGRGARRAWEPATLALQAGERGLQGLAQVFASVLLAHHAPPFAVVNERGDAVYFSPGVGRYLETPAGVPRLGLVDLARSGLRLDLHTALHKAISAGEPAVREGVAVEAEGGTRRVDLTVRPLTEPEEAAGLYMVVFEESAVPPDPEPWAAAPGQDGTPAPGDPPSLPIVRRLEAELQSTRAHLQATLEELESSNEELVSSNEELLSMNEELQSANEELQTSKEELQSVNQELETVNAELKKKLEELDRANSDLLNLFESTRIATIFLDRGLRIQRFTPAATQLFRLIEADLGRPLADIAPRFTGVDLPALAAQVLATPGVQEQQVYLAEPETWYLLRVLPYRTLEGEADGAVLTFVDITELKRSGAALRRSEGRLRRLVEGNVIGVICSSASGGISEANDAFLEMVGYSREDLRAGLVRWNEMTPPEHAPADARGIAEAGQRGACAPYEKEYIRKDGSRVPILIGYARLEGSEEEYVGFIVDLTVQKRLETDLREASRRKDEFLAMLGHELRNPLAPIRNSLHLLGLSGTNGEQGARARETIERQVAHLTRLVDDLLDMARVARGRIHLQPERLDLAELVRSEVEDHRAGFESAGLSVACELPDLPAWVEGDRTRLSQSVGNVLRNAGKFTEPGGRIVVAVREEPGEGTVAVAVRDTGLGMPPELLSRLFEPFSQADRSLARSRGGLGLGLALVRSLIELHGGSVEAASAGEGKGAEFTLRLPLAAAAAAGSGPAPAAAPESEGGEHRQEGRRCLVIEDNVDAAESLRLLLELSGHRAEAAFDGPQGLALARELGPEVVLCDIGLPGDMNGYEVARAFRRDPGLRAVVLIALTGYGQEDDRERAREAGFDAHLTKPADPGRLMELIAELTS